MTLDEYKKAALTPPDSWAYFGDRDLTVWGRTSFAKHRDADILARVNYDRIAEDLLAEFPDAFEVLPSSHWLVGSCDELMVDTSNTAALERAHEIFKDLRSDPVYDVQAWSDAESEAEFKDFEEYVYPAILDAIEADDETLAGTLRDSLTPDNAWTYYRDACDAAHVCWYEDWLPDCEVLAVEFVRAYKRGVAHDAGQRDLFNGEAL